MWACEQGAAHRDFPHLKLVRVLGDLSTGFIYKWARMHRVGGGIGSMQQASQCAARRRASARQTRTSEWCWASSVPLTRVDDRRPQARTDAG